MAVTLTDLVTTVSASEVEAELFEVLESVGFKPTSWQAGSVPLHLVKSFATVTASLYVVIIQLAAGGMLSFATGLWLTILAKDVYDIDRDPATATEGLLLLSDDASGGPYDITEDVTRFQTSDGSLQFVASASGTLTAGGTLSVAVRAEKPGAAHNIANDTTIELVTDLPGVAVSNPDPGTGTWITSVGTDEQTDASLRDECRSKWSTLGVGVPGPAFEAWAKKAVPSITRVRVYDDNPLGPGSIRVLVANSAGTATADELAAVDAFLRPRKPLGSSTFVVDPATTVPVTVRQVVTVASSKRLAAEVQLSQNFADLAASTPIGDEVPLSSIYAAASSVDGVVKVVMVSPTSDTPLGIDEVPVFDLTLTAWVEV